MISTPLTCYVTQRSLVSSEPLLTLRASRCCSSSGSPSVEIEYPPPAPSQEYETSDSIFEFRVYFDQWSAAVELWKPNLHFHCSRCVSATTRLGILRHLCLVCDERFMPLETSFQLKSVSLQPPGHLRGERTGCSLEKGADDSLLELRASPGKSRPTHL